MAEILTIDEVKRRLPKRRQELYALIDELCRDTQMRFDFGEWKRPKRQPAIPFQKRKRA